jgi:Ribbon-helix-helix protein, copG family
MCAWRKVSISARRPLGIGTHNHCDVVPNGVRLRSPYAVLDIRDAATASDPLVNRQVLALPAGAPAEPGSGGLCIGCLSSSRTQVYLTDDQRQRIDRVAATDGLTMSQVIRHAVDEYLDDRPDPDAALVATLVLPPTPSLLLETRRPVADLLIDTDIFIDHLRGASEFRPKKHRSRGNVDDYRDGSRDRAPRQDLIGHHLRSDLRNDEAAWLDAEPG